MYHHVAVPAGLAFTGFALGYWLLAAFALLAVGIALLRVAPRLSRRRAR